MRSVLTGLLLAGLLPSLISCAVQSRRENTMPVAPQVAATADHTVFGGLPAPSQLAALSSQATEPRHVSLSEADIYRQGSQYLSELSSNRIVPESAALQFLPQYSGGEPLSELAYAIYSFDCGDYEREPLIRLSWQTAPADSDLWLGLADFSRDRWRIYQPAAGQLNFGSLEGLLSPASELYAVLLLGGQQAALLDSLRLGEVYPYAAISLSAQQGTAPLTVALDASGSSTPEGELTLFEWDFDGDGIFDEDSAGTPQIEHVYESAGSFTPRVRVTNSAGHSATASAAPLAVQDSWEHSLAKSGYWSLMSTVAAAPDGAIYSAGTLQRYLTDNAMLQLLCRWSRDGELEWAHWGDFDPRLIEDIAVDSVGNIILAGYSGDSGILQKWSPAGEVLWQKEIDAVNADLSFRSLCIAGTDIFLCGNFEADAGADPDAIVARFSTAGELVWHYSYDWFEEHGVELKPRQTAEGIDCVVALMRVDKLSAPSSTFPLFASFELDGTYMGDVRLSADGSTVTPGAFEMQHDDQSGLTKLYVACRNGNGPVNPLQICGVDADLDGLTHSALFQRFWNSGASSQPRDLQISPGGDLLIAGNSSGWPALWRASADDGEVLAAEGYVLSIGDGWASDMQLVDGRILASGYLHSYPGVWQALPAAQVDSASEWLPGSGLVSGETLSVADDIQEFSSTDNLQIDSDVAEHQGWLFYRDAP